MSRTLPEAYFRLADIQTVPAVVDRAMQMSLERAHA